MCYINCDLSRNGICRVHVFHLERNCRVAISSGTEFSACWIPRGRNPGYLWDGISCWFLLKQNYPRADSFWNRMSACQFLLEWNLPRANFFRNGIIRMLIPSGTEIAACLFLLEWNLPRANFFWNGICRVLIPSGKEWAMWLFLLERNLPCANFFWNGLYRVLVFPPESCLLHAELPPERNLPRVDLIGLIATGHDIQSGVQKRKIEKIA